MSGVNFSRGKMTPLRLPFFLCAVVVVFVGGKTIRSKLYTNENGTRELVFDDYTDVAHEDVKSLLENLKSIGVTSPVGSAFHGEKEEKSREKIQMKHWNSLTEAGWKNYGDHVEQSGGPEKGPEDDGHSEEETRPETGSEVETRAEAEGESGEGNETIAGKTRLKASTSRTFLHPRRVLHKILLPLLVVLVIKYLVTLPFVAVSAFTLNSMWLGLLSLAAVFINKLKHQERVYPKWPVKRWSHYHGPEVFETQTIMPTEIVWGPIRVPVTPANIPIEESPFG